jgi:hypothetical protein
LEAEAGTGTWTGSSSAAIAVTASAPSSDRRWRFLRGAIVQGQIVCTVFVVPKVRLELFLLCPKISRCSAEGFTAVTPTLAVLVSMELAATRATSSITIKTPSEERRAPGLDAQLSSETENDLFRFLYLNIEPQNSHLNTSSTVLDRESAHCSHLCYKLSRILISKAYDHRLQTLRSFWSALYTLYH